MNLANADSYIKCLQLRLKAFIVFAAYSMSITLFFVIPNRQTDIRVQNVPINSYHHLKTDRHQTHNVPIRSYPLIIEYEMANNELEYKRVYDLLPERIYEGS